MSKPIFLIPEEDPARVYINQTGHDLACKVNIYDIWSIAFYLSRIAQSWGPPPSMVTLLQTAQFSWVTHVIPWGGENGARSCKNRLEREWRESDE